MPHTYKRTRTVKHKHTHTQTHTEMSQLQKLSLSSGLRSKARLETFAVLTTQLTLCHSTASSRNCTVHAVQNHTHRIANNNFNRKNLKKNMS